MASNKYSNKFAELYEKCMDEFVEQLSVLSEDSLHVIDIEYFDGYFVFDRGRNSITHFHVTECPGWKFGIWWTPVLENEDDPEEFPKFVEAEIFAQYERTIDKFKPSATMISETTKVDLSLRGSEYYNNNFFECYLIIKYIRDEPELAYCRNEFYLDYNIEYLSREDAKKKFKKSIDYLDKCDRVTSQLDKEILDFVVNTVIPEFKTAAIHDSGKNCYPRYHIVAPKSSIHVNIAGHGCYDIQPFISDKVYHQFKECIDMMDSKAEAENVFYHSPIDMIIHIVDDSKENQDG